MTCALAVAPSAPPRAERADWVRTESFRLMNEGINAYTNGRYAEAVEKLQKSTSMALNSFRAHLYLGLALNGERRYQDAIDALEIALDLDPEHLNALNGLGDAHLMLGDINEARAAYFRALKVRPEYPASLDGIARSYESQAKDPEAIEYYRRAIKSNAGYAEAYSHLGELYLRQARYEEAVELLEEAVTIRPDFADGHTRLALAYSQLGMFNEAVASIERAIDLEPASPDHPAALGIIQVDLGLLVRAEATFLETLAIDPGHPLALRGMAEIARRRGEYDLALKHVDAALADDRLDARRIRGLTAYREALSDEKIRVEALEAADASGEATAEQLRELAVIYAGRLLWDRAADLEARTEPDGEDLERLAYLLLRAQRYRESLELYARLIQDVGKPEYSINRGVALSQLGLHEEAAVAFRAALATQPDSDVAQLYLGNALLRLGRRDEAADVYVSFLEMSERSEQAERVRRILEQIAPERNIEPEDDRPPLPFAPEATPKRGPGT